MQRKKIEEQKFPSTVVSPRKISTGKKERIMESYIYKGELRNKWLHTKSPETDKKRKALKRKRKKDEYICKRKVLHILKAAFTTRGYTLNKGTHKTVVIIYLWGY